MVDTLLNIGIALSKEKDTDKLIEIIIDSVMELVRCDGGTLYLLEENALHFKIMITQSLGFRKNAGDEMPPPMQLNRENMCARAALEKRLINIDDVYENSDFNFAGSRKVDALMGYRTRSMLTVPMEDDHGDVIGVLQLINALDEDNEVIPFAHEYEKVLLSIASQAAICLTNRKYAAEVMSLLDSFVIAMSAAIDARSPYNANHSRNMARYGKRFIHWLNQNGGERFDTERENKFLMSLLLHDIGKLVVPLEVMDKETRLGPRLGTVLTRFETLRMQAEIDYLRGNISEAEYKVKAEEAGNARALVEKANASGFIPDDMLAELQKLCQKEGFLTPEEQRCLLVRRGTLTDEERTVMEGHVDMTTRILSEVRFPKNYRMVPVWAAAHHEFLNGKGYPNQLTADEIPTEVRIATILDIYDALTAHDRPYKRGLPDEKAFEILGGMAAQGQLDAGLLALFKESGAWNDEV
ncbi:MAG: GAF domain-containing protein [Defluviitaleaceae bacterium]|nr:GAF domain-containing protein [Defluviitaleaceae bacterium]